MLLLIRADATAEIGAGHVMRCATLAEAWVAERLGAARVCGEIAIPFVAKRLHDLGVSLSDAGAADERADVLLIDSYDPSVRNEVGSRKARLRVVVDDVGDQIPPGTDIIWNPNPYGSATLYDGFAGELLAGPPFVPIREGLPRWQGRNGEGTAVALGGAAVRAMVRDTVASALSDARFQPVVGVGRWIPAHWSAADPDAPWDRLVSCRRAVVGAGTSTWEAALVGIPSVMLCIADNQRLALDWFRRIGSEAIDLTSPADEKRTEELQLALAAARPLPRLENGARRVAATLHSRARGRSYR